LGNDTNAIREDEMAHDLSLPVGDRDEMAPRLVKRPVPRGGPKRFSLFKQEGEAGRWHRVGAYAFSPKEKAEQVYGREVVQGWMRGIRYEVREVR
jgi:hypothetical protein